MFGGEAQMKTDDHILCEHIAFTDQFVLFDEAAKFSTRNQFTPLSQDELRTEEDTADETSMWTNPPNVHRMHVGTCKFILNTS